MKMNANSIRRGNILEVEGELYMVAKDPEHTKPGKGGAFVQVELKGLVKSTKLNRRFRSDEDIVKIRVDDKDFQYLYPEGDLMVLMDPTSFEQVHVNADLLGEALPLLKEGMEVTLELYNGNPISARLPETIETVVEVTEPVVKGQTAASSNKPATVEGGVRVMVPPFINVEDRIIIRTADFTYVERAK